MLVDLCLESGAVEFGQFELKSKRTSPYFINAGRLLASSKSLAALSRSFEQYIRSNYDALGRPTVLFGAAYKGIPLVAGIAVLLADVDIKVAFNRKEPKLNADRGVLFGYRPDATDRVLIIDDVLTAGTAVRECVEQIRTCSASIAGVLVAVDRQERGPRLQASAVDELAADIGAPVSSLARISDFVDALERNPATLHHADVLRQHLARNKV